MKALDRSGGRHSMVKEAKNDVDMSHMERLIIITKYHYDYKIL